jgi:hypothetical protein
MLATFDESHYSLCHCMRAESGFTRLTRRAADGFFGQRHRILIKVRDQIEMKEGSEELHVICR